MKITKITIFIMVVCCTQFSFAQQITDTTKPKTISLDEIIISANKFAETKKTVAQQIQVLDQKQIAASQSQTTADLIANTGSVTVQKSQLGGGSPVLRGFEASRIVLVVDGIRMNNILYRAGHLQNIVTLDNAILDRTEILFGPSSTMYGSDALGGVIHFYTKKPNFAEGDKKINLKINAFSRYGSVNNEITGHVDFNIGGKKFASLTSVTYSKFGDLKGGKNQNPFYNGTYGERPYYVQRIDGKDSLVKNDNRYKQVQSAYSQYDILQKFAYKQNEHITHGLNFQFSNSTDVPRYDRLTDPSGSGLKYAEFYYGPQKRLLGAYDMNYHNDDAVFQNIHAGISYQNIEESRHSRKFGKDNLSNQIEKVHVIGLDVDFQKIIKKNNIRFGIDGQFNTLKSTASYSNIVTGEVTPYNTRYPDGKNTMTNLGVYASHTWQISEKLALTDGLRVGYSMLHSTFVDTTFFKFPFDEVNQNNLVYSGSLGLIHTPSENLKFSFLLSSGFRTPNVDDLSKVFETAPGNIIVPNSSLKPEKTINTEIGITKIFEEKVLWENTVYYTEFFDAIVTDKFQYNNQDSILYDGTMSQVLANQNKKHAYLFGASSNVKAQVAENFLMTFGLNYTYGRIKTDSSDYPMDHIPPFMMHLQLAYKYKNFSTDFTVKFNGAKNLKDYNLEGEDNEQYATDKGMPAWVTANIHISYKVWKYITLQAGVDNIFDTQYRVFASGINAPGRNIYGAIRFSY
ncbi:MAG TPA: TonB-dependent receptor [Bacteroidales bacterium]|nr:TonB-dependent receptor [Bacteroidales bacterium]